MGAPAIDGRDSWNDRSLNVLRRSVGAFCAFLGALLLIAPRESAAATIAVGATTSWIGAFYFLAGATLMVTMVVPRARSLAIGPGLVVAALLVWVAIYFVRASLWPVALDFGVIGLGAALAALPRPVAKVADAPSHREALSVLIAAAAILAGLYWLTIPARSVPLVPLSRPALLALAALTLAGGVALGFDRLGRGLPTGPAVAVHLGLGAAFLVWAWVYLFPPVWLAVAFYLTFGVALGLLAWRRYHPGSMDVRSMQVQLAVALALGAAIPILVVAVPTEAREDQTALATARSGDQTLAVAMAHDLGDDLRLREDAVLALASVPGLLEEPAPVQHSTLSAFAEAYPEIYSFATYNAAGQGIARSDAQPVRSLAADPLFQSARDSIGPGLEVRLGRRTHQPLIVFGAPVRDRSGQFAGLVVAMLQATQLSNRLNQSLAMSGARLQVVDSRGRLVAGTDGPEPPTLTDLSGTLAVAAALGASRSGTIDYALNGRPWLAGYARVPTYGWEVVVSEPEAVALAAGQNSRLVLLETLLLVVGCVSVLALVIARTLTSPLRQLARAVDDFETERVALAPSGVTEIASLTAAFEALRARLKAKTDERDRAEEALRQRESSLRFLAEAGAVLAGSLDYETTLQAVTRLAVPALADLCVVDLLRDDGSPNGNVANALALGGADETATRCWQIERVAATADDESKASALWSMMRRFAPDPTSPHPIAKVLRTGQAVLVPAVTPEFLRHITRDDQHLAVSHALRQTSSMVVPLTARGRTFGAVSFISAESGRRYGPGDLALAEELCRRAALAVDNARLFDDEKQARAKAEAAERHLAEQQRVAEGERAMLAAIMGGMSDGLLVLGADRTVRYCNARAGELLGVNPHTAPGLPLVILAGRFPPALATLASALQDWETLLPTTDDHCRFEIDVAGADPRRLAVDLFPVAVSQADGLLTEPGVAALIHDLTLAQTLAALRERERIAMDLHDGVIQSLYAVALGLAARDRTLSTSSVDQISLALRHGVSQVNAVIQDIRNYIFDLRIDERTTQGLQVGLEAIAEELRINALIHATVEVDPAAANHVSAETVSSLLQVAREATSNVIRHAAATAVTISFRPSGDCGVALSIRDNGRGFDRHGSPPRAGQGLRNMAKRARRLAGQLTIESEPGHGTEIRLSLATSDGAEVA